MGSTFGSDGDGQNGWIDASDTGGDFGGGGDDDLDASWVGETDGGRGKGKGDNEYEDLVENQEDMDEVPEQESDDFDGGDSGGDWG